jgi:hypothetical protein
MHEHVRQSDQSGSDWRLLLHTFLPANMELGYDAFHASMLASLAARGAIVAAALYLASAAGKAGGLLTVHASAFACGRQEIKGVERAAGCVDQV